MRLRNEAGLRTLARRAMLPLTVAFTVIGCATTGPAPQRTTETAILNDASGFTIAEEARIAADSRNQYEAAMRLLEQEEYDQGIALLLEVAESASGLSAPHIDLGIAYGRSGDLNKGIASLQRALELNPRHPVAYNELGMLHRRKGEFETARASYEKALELSPEFHFARLNLAILCDLYLADLPCALDNYVAYQETVPDDKNAAMWIADLRARVNH